MSMKRYTRVFLLLAALGLVLSPVGEKTATAQSCSAIGGSCICGEGECDTMETVELCDGGITTCDTQVCTSESDNGFTSKVTFQCFTE